MSDNALEAILCQISELADYVKAGIKNGHIERSEKTDGYLEGLDKVRDMIESRLGD